MANLATLAAQNVVNLFTAAAGNGFTLDAVAQNLAGAQNEILPRLSIASVLLGNSPPDLLEKSLAIRYPTVSVYCDKLTNTLKEKFRVFSGTADVTVEIRQSQDRVQNIQPELETFVAAACQILDGARGDWGNGLFYAGGYEVSFLPMKRGGADFLQIARLTLTVDISV